MLHVGIGIGMLHLASPISDSGQQAAKAKEKASSC